MWRVAFAFRQPRGEEACGLNIWGDGQQANGRLSLSLFFISLSLFYFVASGRGEANDDELRIKVATLFSLLFFWLAHHNEGAAGRGAGEQQAVPTQRRMNVCRQISSLYREDQNTF